MFGSKGIKEANNHVTCVYYFLIYIFRNKHLQFLLTQLCGPNIQQHFLCVNDVCILLSLKSTHFSDLHRAACNYMAICCKVIYLPAENKR